MKIHLVFLLALVSVSSFASIPRFEKVHPHLYRGGQPSASSDYSILKEVGIRTILNLRTTEEDIVWEQKNAKASGIKFIHLPTSPVVGPQAETMARALRIIEEPSNQPVFVHCREGEDRAGLTIGLYRVYYDKWSSARAYEEMVEHGFKQYLLGLTSFFWRFTEIQKLPL